MGETGWPTLSHDSNHPEMRASSLEGCKVVHLRPGSSTNEAQIPAWMLPAMKPKGGHSPRLVLSLLIYRMGF